MNNFNYNNYIGEHMSEPLRVLDNEDGKYYDFIGLDATSKGDIMLISDYEIGTDHDLYNSECFKPLIKSPSDLTDEEWLFVFGGDSDDYFIYDRKHSIHFKDYETETLLNRAMKEDYSIEVCNQQILNRLYSLHCHPNAEELIKNNKAVRRI